MVSYTCTFVPITIAHIFAPKQKVVQMSQPKYCFVPTVRFNLDPEAFDGVKLFAKVNGYAVPFVQDTSTGDLYLPVVPNAGFALHVANYTHTLAAFPARIGDGTNWTNVFRECSIIDPNVMP